MEKYILFKKQLKENRVLNLVTPFCMFQNENSFYEKDYLLHKDCANLEKEILLYLEGKHAPALQMEMNFNTPMDAN